MKTYESSTATLRTLLSHPSLQRSHVDATLEALAEVNAEQRELDEAIKIGGDVAVGVGESVDEGEIADELETLVREAKREEEEREERRRLEEARNKIPVGPKGDVGLGLEEELEKLKLGEGRESATAGLREGTDSKQAVAEPAS
jgi:charged multivesicular body protein 7